MTYKIYCSLKQRKYNLKDSIAYATFCVISKFPQVQGQIKYHLHRRLGRKINLIEYKG